MNHEPSVFLLILIGIAAGLTTGFFGLAGGLIIIPALIYVAGFSQLTATGTYLVICLFPVSLAAAIEYYRHGHADIRATIIIGISLFITAWVSSHFANRVNDIYLRLSFGIFIALMGIYIVYTTLSKRGTP
jgi:uncharacterized membrane protein YfcA